MEPKYSSNRGWKNRYSFASGQWEFAPSKKAQGPRVPRETNLLSEKGHHAPRLTSDEISQVNDVLDWARKHDSSMLFEVLCTVPKLVEFIYKPAGHATVKITEEVARVRFNYSPPAANTQGVTPRKDQTQAAGKGKSSQLDKGKGKMIESEKPRKAAPFPLQTGGAFKIRDREPALPAPKAPQPVLGVKSPTEAPRVARVLRLVDDEEDVEAEHPAEVASVPARKAPTPREESKVKVIEAPLPKKIMLRKIADVAVPPAAPAAVNMANFLANRKRQVPPPSVPRMDAVEAFLANEPMEAISVTVAPPAVEEPIRAPKGPLPPSLGHPLSSNIQHILEEIDIESKESVGMVDHHSGPLNAAVEKAPWRPMSQIPEVGTSPRTANSKRSRDLILGEDNRASVLKKPQASEALESESSTEIQLEGANWKVGRKLAKLGGDLNGNPFKAVLDLINHDKLQMKRDISTRGMAEEMLTFQFLVSFLVQSFYSLIFSLLLT